MKRSYTYQQRREVLSLYSTHTVAEIAKLTGLADYTVRNIVYYSPLYREPKLRHWTDDEIQYLRENYKILTDTKIAKYLNRTRQSVSSKLMKLHLHRAGKRQIAAIEEAMKVYTTCTNDDLIEIFHLSRRTLLNAAYRRGLVKDPSVPNSRGRKKKQS